MMEYNVIIWNVMFFTYEKYSHIDILVFHFSTTFTHMSDNNVSTNLKKLTGFILDNYLIN